MDGNNVSLVVLTGVGISYVQYISRFSVNVDIVRRIQPDQLFPPKDNRAKNRTK
jgi:hypothetical protein